MDSAPPTLWGVAVATLKGIVVVVVFWRMVRLRVAVHLRVQPDPANFERGSGRDRGSEIRGQRVPEHCIWSGNAVGQIWITKRPPQYGPKAKAPRKPVLVPLRNVAQTLLFSLEWGGRGGGGGDLGEVGGGAGVGGLPERLVGRGGGGAGLPLAAMNTTASPLWGLRGSSVVGGSGMQLPGCWGVQPPPPTPTRDHQKGATQKAMHKTPGHEGVAGYQLAGVVNRAP